MHVFRINESELSLDAESPIASPATCCNKVARLRPKPKKKTREVGAIHKARRNATFGYANDMAVNLPLNEMTVPEQLRVMELLWEDLSRNSEALVSPEWHQGVLDEREERIVTGKSSFTEWEKAKAEIRQRAA
jgi:hypothetical protein